VFGGLLAVIAAIYYFTKISHTLLFWPAFILTRPLGAVVGDFLDKPRTKALGHEPLFRFGGFGGADGNFCFRVSAQTGEAGKFLNQL